MTPPATHYARCPGCQTVFRVSEAQLALREGQVRCGNCRAVFDANRERVAQEAEAIAEVPDPVEPADIVEEPAAENALDDAATETADPVEAVPLVVDVLARSLPDSLGEIAIVEIENESPSHAESVFDLPFFDGGKTRHVAGISMTHG